MKKERQTWKIRLARGYHLFLSVTPSLVAIIFLYAAVMSLPGSKEGKHRGHTHLESEKTAKEKKSESTAEIYTCSMHPSVRSFTPGKCPICGMDLILVAGDSSTGSWEISLTPRALALAAVETSRVVLRKPTNEVRLIGHVAYDEGREVKVASWVSGRIEHLYVNITGQKIRAYQPLMSIYSPELYTAQLELVRLLKSTGTNENQYLQGVITSGVESVKTKLRLLGMSGGQIRQVIRTRKAMERVVIYAPQGGTVTRRHVSLGSYVATGSPLISLSTEHKLWVFFDVQEKDLHLIRLGQGLTYSVDALKGLAFVGRVQFIDPLVDKATGTIRVRASVDNPEALLKEGMYIRGVAHTAELKALPSVPIQAVLYTGRRSVVYVKVPGKEAAFEGRQITIGARTGSYQLVLEGLREGEEVVTRGNFMIDSALQISARSSMMSHEGEQVREKDQGHGQFDVPRIWAPEAFKREIGALVKGYFPIHEALKKDDLARATAASGKFFTQLASIKHHDPVWDTFRTIMGTFAGTLRVAKSIGEARDAFFSLARAMILTVKSYGVSVEGSVYLHYCPMARKNRGGWWLAPKKEIENPFFGAGMFSCGENLGLLHGPTPQKAKGGADAK